MESSGYPEHFLAELFRFAVLLTADEAAASQAVANSFADTSGHFAQLRTDQNRQTWLVGKVRELCLVAQKAGPAADGCAPEVARQFHGLPEPTRSAAALFYLDLMSTEEIAHVLSMSLEELSEHLSKARTVLRQSPAISQ
jgi:DNA-directed RNA polymerase specialized sigma24 family protein